MTVSDQDKAKLNKLVEQLKGFDFSSIGGESSSEDRAIAAEIMKKFNEYYGTGDLESAKKYLIHMKDELRNSA